MNKNEKLVSLEIERACLASLIRFNNNIPDIAAFIKPDFFSNDINSTVFSCIISTYQAKGRVDQILLTEQLHQIGIREIQGVEIYRYIEVIFNTPVNEDSIFDYYTELFKLSRLRKTSQNLADALTFINNNKSKSLTDILYKISQITTDAVTGNLGDEDEQVIDLYGEIQDELSKRAKEKPKPTLITKFSNFDKWYGGIHFEDLFVFAAPAKRGKSTFLNWLAYQIAAEESNNVKVLYLDTEMETWRVMCRAASSLTDINEWFFKNGRFSEDRNMVHKVNEMYRSLEPVKGRVFHKYIGNKSIDDVIAICRRWYMKHVKPGENALIAYDYIKLDGDGTQLSDHHKEYQAVGEKTDKLKKLASSYPNLAIITSVQTNANGDIAMSQRIKWYASNIFVLKPKTPEEIQEEGEQFGTHKLIELAARVQGEDAHGMNRLIKVAKADGTTEYRDNFINFKFSKFKVTECGTNEEILTQKSGQLKRNKFDDSDIDF